jgi:hypothetical protein
VARGLTMRHDHGSQYMSDDFHAELRFLGTVLPHPQGTAALGAALHRCRGPAAGPAHLQGDL